MDLTDAFGIGRKEVVALVGGGGKTTAMYRLCAEAAARGRRAVASGTARFTAPFGGAAVPSVSEEDETRLIAGVRGGLDLHPWLIAAGGRGAKERFQPLSYEAVERIAALAGLDLLALEADGSAMRSFKAPAEHEPAVPPIATLVIAVVGSDVFGRPLTDEAVHRPERVTTLSGAAPGEAITPEVVAAVLADGRGGRKGVPARARFAVLINKVNEARLSPARRTGHLLRDRGVPLVVLAQARNDPPVVEVVQGERA